MTCELLMRVQLSLSDGEELARYTVTLDSYSASASGSMTIHGVNARHVSGIRVPAGDTLTLRTDTIAEGYGCTDEQFNY